MMALKARVVDLEAKHLGVKNQIFEMESKLLKCISDNKQYVVRKIKELTQTININGKVTHALCVLYIYLMILLLAETTINPAGASLSQLPIGKQNS